MTPTRRRLALPAFLSLQVTGTPSAAVGASAPATHHLQARLPEPLDALHLFLRAPGGQRLQHRRPGPGGCLLALLPR
jgi:hypothetical protein